MRRKKSFQTLTADVEGGVAEGRNYRRDGQGEEVTAEGFRQRQGINLAKPVFSFVIIS